MRPEIASVVAQFAAMVCVKSLLLFAATGALLLALRKASAAARAMALQLCLAALVVLPLLSIVLPPFRVSIPRSSVIAPRQASLQASAPSSPRRSQVVPRSIGAVAPTGVQQQVPSGEPAVPSFRRPRAAGASSSWVALVTVWAAGALLLLAKLVCSAFQLWRLSVKSKLAPGWIVSAAHELEYSRRVRIVIATDSKSSPMTWGIVRPKILLPSEAADWSRERLTPVLLHELGHIARYDWPTLLFADLAAIVYWFNPLVWLLRRRLRAECELACDDRVLGHGVGPQEYASLLLDIARTSLSRKPISALSLAIAIQSQGGSVLERRLRSVLHSSTRRRPVSRASAILGMLGLIVTVSPLAAARIAKEQPLPTIDSIARVADQPLSFETENTDAHQSTDYASRASMPGYLRTSEPSQSALQTAQPVHGDASNAPVATPSGPAADGVAWGRPESGLAAGLRSPDNRSGWRYGEIVEMEYIIRNVSNKPISFEHYVTPGVAGVISDIVDSNGKPARTIGLPGQNTSETRHVVLDPGSSVVIGKTRMGVLPVAGSQRGISSPASNWVEAAPGEYRMRHLDTVYLTNSGKVTLHTGYLPLVIETDKWANLEAASNGLHAQPPASPDSQLAGHGSKAGPDSFDPGPGSSVSWGKSIGGLRAGLVLHSKYAVRGKDIITDLYINNTSKHEIKIDYLANDDKFYVPDLWNAKHEKLKYDWRNMTVEQKIAGNATLKPGESVCVGHPGLNISTWGHDEEAQLNEGTDFTHFISGKGEYHMRFTANLMGAGSKWNYYQTGEVTFTLVDYDYELPAMRER